MEDQGICGAFAETVMGGLSTQDSLSGALFFHLQHVPSLKWVPSLLFDSLFFKNIFMVAQNTDTGMHTNQIMV